MKSDFVHLHAHTEFSTLDGMPKVEEYVIRAVELGQPSLALTEHGNMRSMYQFQIKSTQGFDYNGQRYDFTGLIKPIFGIEFYASLHDYKLKGLPESEKTKIRRECNSEAEYKAIVKEKEQKEGYKARFHVLAFAKNQVGLQNLFLLNYLSWKHGFFYRPRIDTGLLFKYHEGIVITTACIGGYAPEMVLQGKESLAEKWIIDAKKVFKDDLYIEIQPHKLLGDKDSPYKNVLIQKVANQAMVSYANSHNIKIVATNDCHYLLKEDAESHNVLLAVNQRGSINSEDAWTFGDKGFYLKTKDEMFRTFKTNHGDYLSDKVINTSLETTMEIVEKCNSKLEIDRKKGILPVVETKGMPEDVFLEKLCFRGWKKFRNMEQIIAEYAEHYGVGYEVAWQTYLDRMYFELKRIKDLKFAKYFLIIYDLITWARKNDIMVGPGRGSSSASLVCYLLGITSVDPLFYNLYFERFLAPGRIDYPDIDMDFEDTRRKEIFKYLVKKYGENNVCQIGTVGRMKGKQALHDVGRALDVPAGETMKITKHIIQRSSGDARTSQSVVDSFKEFDVCIEYNKKYPDVLKHVIKLEGKARQVGIHAAGIQIADRPMHQIVPIEYRETKDAQGNKERIKVAGLDWLECQGLGLVKLDVLGLRTLSILKTALKSIKQRKGIDLNLEEVSLKDEKTLQGFTDGKFVGIFQFDSIGMTKTCEKLTFRSFEDVIALNALYRPGCCKVGTKVLLNWNDPNNKTFVKIEDLFNKFNGASDYVKSVKRNFNIVSYDVNRNKYVKNKIVGVYKSGVKSCYKLKLRHLREIQTKKRGEFTPVFQGDISVSMEHKILTLDRGWQQAKNLKYGDYVLFRFQHIVANARRSSGSDFKGKSIFFYKERCAICNYQEQFVPLDTHHLDGNRNNHNEDNLLIVCPNCHREIEYGKYNWQYIKERQKLNRLPNSHNNPFRWTMFLGLEYEGDFETYDIEMEMPYNNFIAGGIVVHNSMRSGLATHYINRAIGKEKIKPLHPIYDDICKETYGILVYQEQLIKCFRDMAGYEEATADELRKKISKSAGVETLGKESDKFISGAIAKGMTEKQAKELFENMAFFGSYAFNKAHAAAYGMIAYWGMYLKVHYAVEFFHALMRHEPEKNEILRFVSDARKSDLDVKTPDINHSDIQFRILDDKTIISGLVDIKGCGMKASVEIAEKQPYNSLHDLLGKVNRRHVHKGVIGALVKAGAFRSLYPSIGAMLVPLTVTVKRKGGVIDEIDKCVWEQMVDKKPEDAENIYKEYDIEENVLDEEQEVKVMSDVCPIPPYRHKIEYYEKVKKYIFTDREHMETYLGIDEVYDNESEFSDSGLHRTRGVFMGTLVDIKYNNVGDFHKDEPSDKEKKRIGWGKRYANVNIENPLGIRRINIDIDVFPTFRQIIDRGLQTPVLIIGNLLKWSEVIYADVIVDLDEFRDILELDIKMIEKYQKMNPFQKYLIKHPCSRLKEQTTKSDINDLKYGVSQGVREIMALVTRVKYHWTKKDKKMAFVEIEDVSGNLSCILWPEGVLKYGQKIKVGSVIKAFIKKNKDGCFIEDKRKLTVVKTFWNLEGHIQGETSNKDILEREKTGQLKTDPTKYLTK